MGRPGPVIEKLFIAVKPRPQRVIWPPKKTGRTQLVKAVLGFLEKNEEITDSGQFAAERGIDHQDHQKPSRFQARRCSVGHMDFMEIVQDIKRERWVLTEEGKTYAAAGSPEVQVFMAVPPEGISLDELQVQDVDDKVKDLLIRIQDGEVIMSVIDLLSLFQFRVLRSFTQKKLMLSNDGSSFLPSNYLPGGNSLFTFPRPWKGYSVRKGPKYAPRRKKFATDLTRENILSCIFESIERLDVNPPCGQKGLTFMFSSAKPRCQLLTHKLNISDHKICISCMKTAKIIAKAIVVIYILVIAGHCATANQDDFPADGMHSHFKHRVYISTPSIFDVIDAVLKKRASVRFWSWALVFAYRFEEMPTNNFVKSSFWNFDALFQLQQHPAHDSHDAFFLQDYVERVKHVHEFGGYGSRGYGYEWKREEANKNLLRTHTTAVSSRMLNSLAQKDFVPKKYFSIDRVFRNEAVDRTHLAEFHQIEGMSKLKFKPAYNPYTEPSMEIFRWILVSSRKTLSVASEYKGLASHFLSNF
ncbi:hypothetical protein RHSIM_Rhsim05G0074300 [Rhododendron simsii]|uniref:Phenylalanyl-tRNA synthetase domain-containing protein n=1 Tax=Rhododendron simsii TaxID=118357 RepID=A0A834GZF9_RHOSS|nr:hypothetical protein RHSIM_Rhsim05G0074300 [Rhododendron simsii]